MRSLGLVFLALAAVACARAQVNVIYGPPMTTVVIGRSPSAEETARQVESPPSIQKSYFIAFKGGSVRLAEQYWVDGSTLYYVTPEHERKTAPVASVDPVLSVRLNMDQNMLFTLPAAEEKAEVRPRPIHRATGSASRQKSCACR